MHPQSRPLTGNQADPQQSTAISRRRQWLLASLAVGLPLFVVCVVVELLFGRWFKPEDPWRRTLSLNIIRNESLEIDTTAVYGPKIPHITYSRDQYGLRSSCERPEDIRILTLGGSTTDNRLVGDGDTWQDHLQTALEADAGEPMCVANAGVDGHSTYGHVEAMKVWLPLIPNLQPRVVMLYIGINDAGFRDAPVAGYDQAAPDPLETLKANSAIYDAGRTLKALLLLVFDDGDDRLYASHEPVNPLTADYVVSGSTPGAEAHVHRNAAEFGGRLEELLRRVRLMDATPVCISQPHRFTREVDGELRGVRKAFIHRGITYSGIDYQRSISELNAVMARVCPKFGGHYVDLSARKFEDEDYYDLVHMTPHGMKHVAQYIHEMLPASLLDTQAPNPPEDAVSTPQ